MNYKQIETSRELRLWLTQIVAPAAMALYIFLKTPEGKEVSAEAKKKLKTLAKKLGIK